MPSPLAPPVLGAFQLLRPIGRGGQGAVWLAEHSATGLRVAIKVLATLRAQDASARAAFRREVRSAAALDHPNVILLLDQGEVSAQAEDATGGQLPAGSPWLAMELARGSLGDLSGSRTWAETRAVLQALLKALAHAHSRGVIHRDIKPHNLLFMDRPRTPRQLSRARLADFGLAFRANDKHDTTRRVMAGTPLYMAPEQYGGRLAELGPWTDLYAIGWVAWELAAGNHPLRGRPMEEIQARKTTGDLPLWTGEVAAPDGFGGWVLRLLQLAPTLRFATAADALAALDALPDEAPLPEEDSQASLLEPSGAFGLLPPSQLSAPPAGATVSETTWNLDTLDTDGHLALWTPAPEVEPAARVPAPFPDDWRAEPVVRLPALQGAGRGLLGLRTPPLRGRADLCDQLWGALRTASETGQTRCVLLEGPAGLGKSRLLSWVRQRSVELGAAVVLSLKAGPRATLPGVRGTLLRGFSLQGLPAPDAHRLLERRLGALSLHGPLDQRPLAELAGLVDPQTTERADRLTALYRLTRALTRERPLVLTVDDAPFAEAALRWLSTLRERDDLPVLVVLTARSEDLAENPTAAEALRALCPTVCTVPPLADDDLRSLLGDLLVLEPGLQHQLLRRAAGNPALALQLLADWVAQDLLEPGGGGFRARPGARLPLPDTLHHVWVARLDRLEADLGREAVEAVELAAALGMHVPQAAWSEACAQAGLSVATDRVAEELLSLALAHATAEADAAWVFGHGMLRESAVRRATEAGRAQRHHAAWAAVLDRRGAPSGDVGLHLARAGRPAEAVPRLLDGAKAAIDRDALPTARALLDEASAAASLLDLDADDPARHRAALLAAALATHSGQFAEAQALLAPLEAGAQLSEALRAQVLEALAVANMGALSVAKARSSGEAALGATQASGDTQAVARLSILLASASVAEGQLDQADAWLDQAEAALGDHGPDEHHARLLMGRIQVERGRGDLHEALAHAQEAGSLLEALGRRRRLAQVENTRGDLLRALGDLPEATHAYAAAEDLSASLGTAYATVPRINRGLTLLARERFDEADAVLRQALGEVRAQGHAGYTYAVRHALLVVAAAARDQAQTERHLHALGELRPRGHFVDADLASVAEQAGDLWWRAARRGLADRLWALAEAQWSGLHRTGDAARVQRKRGPARR